MPFWLIFAPLAVAAAGLGNLFFNYFRDRDQTRDRLHNTLQAEMRMKAAEEKRLGAEAVAAAKAREDAAVRLEAAKQREHEARTEREINNAKREADHLKEELKRKEAERTETKRKYEAIKLQNESDYGGVEIPTSEQVRAAKAARGEGFTEQFNVAIIGERGQGKSTFLNALLGGEFAETGANETTRVQTGYPHPGLPQLVWHDIPGANTLGHPLRTYLKDQQLFVFDAYVFCSVEAFKATPDAHLADVFTRLYKRPVAALRTKSDAQVQSDTARFVHRNAVPTEQEAIARLKRSWPGVVAGAMSGVADAKMLTVKERALHTQLIKPFVVSAFEEMKDAEAARRKGYQHEEFSKWVIGILPRELRAMFNMQREKEPMDREKEAVRRAREDLYTQYRAMNQRELKNLLFLRALPYRGILDKEGLVDALVDNELPNVGQLAIM